jgi:hypothetical protein
MFSNFKYLNNLYRRDGAIGQSRAFIKHAQLQQALHGRWLGTKFYADDIPKNIF